jgi:ferrous iron transport protein B
VGAALDGAQLMTLLLFVTFYLPCLSAFAVMTRTLGTRAALQSAGITLAVALGVAGFARIAMALSIPLLASF